MRRRANQMIKLLTKTASYTRERMGNDFIILAQNGLDIVDDASSKWKKFYYQIIDGVSVESLYYNIWSEEDQSYRMDKLKDLNTRNKLIIDIEYLEPYEYDIYWNLWNESDMHIVGYPATTDRALDTVVFY